VPEQGDDAAVRQIVQANSASPHFVGAAITSAQGKELMESPPTVSSKQLAAESDSDLMITFTSSDDDEHEKEEEYSETDIGIFGSDYSSSDNDATKHDDDDIESSDHDDQQEAQALIADDQEEAQALTAHDELIAAASVMNDMLEAEQMQQMRQERLQVDEALKNKMQGLFDFSKKLFITLPEYTKDTKFAFDISPTKLCDHLYDNTVSPEQVYTVLSNTHNDYLVQLQAIMIASTALTLSPNTSCRLSPMPTSSTIESRSAQAVSITFWINLVPWSKLAWLWSDFIAAPPDPPDPPDIPEVSLDEAYAAFAATLPALTVSDTACAQVDASTAAFADSVSDAINIASEAASAINAIPKAKAFALNAASKAAFAKEFDYSTTSAATEAAAGACLYSRCVVPPRCTYLLYSTSLRMPICRIHNPIPYVSTPPSHVLEKGIRGGNPSAVRIAPCSCVSAQSSAVASSRESSVLALSTTDIPVSPHTSNGEILAIVDSCTSKHILQCRTLLANAKEAHVAVSSFTGDTSHSTNSGDLLYTVRTENGQLLPLSDTSSALVPDAKRPLWSVRHAQLAGHEIVLGNRSGLLLQGNPCYFVPLINCPDTGLWLIRQ